jgi:hypothetical protein
LFAAAKPMASPEGKIARILVVSKVNVSGGIVIPRRPKADAAIQRP